MSRGARWWSLAGRDFGALELAVLASGGLLFVPGVQAVWAWPWLWFVPGWFFTRHVLGIRSGFLLLASSLASSIALASLVCLPLTIAAGGPRPWIVVVSVAVVAIACARWNRTPALPAVPWPPLPALGLVMAFVVFRVALAWIEAGDTNGGPDAWYLAGVVRELGVGFPPSNPVAATTILKQPWGYWMLYALTRVAGGLSVGVTLQIASLLLALAFLAAVHVLVTSISGDRRAGGFAMALALGAAELLWLEELAWPTTERLEWQVTGMTSFGMNVVDAFYDVPVLLLAVMVLTFLAAGRPIFAAAFAAVAPFFHPVHAGVLFVALAAGLALDAARGRLTRAHVWLLGAPIPFLLLFVLLYARGLATHAPFVLRPADIGTQLVRHVRWSGLFLPIAIAGALRKDLRLRGPLVALFVVTSALSIFTYAVNYHWSGDLLSVAMIVLGGIALGALSARLPRAGTAIGVGVVLVAIAAAGHPTRLAREKDRRTAEERSAGGWIRANTSPRAVFAIDHRSLPAAATALGLGERRLFLGPIYQFVNTATAAEVDARSAKNLAALRDPCTARREGVHFVLFDRRSTEARARASWPPAEYENAEISIHAVTRACPSP